MDWQTLAEEGVVRPVPHVQASTYGTIRRAWDRVVEARFASLDARWEVADREIRHAFCVATEALAVYHCFTTDGGCSFETARRIGAEYFGEQLAGPIFDKACRLRGMFPLEEQIGLAQAREVRRSVAASAEYVALVECFTYQEQETSAS